MSPESERRMQEIFTKVKEVHDRVPRHITEVLELITHPDVIDLTQSFIDERFADIDSDIEDEEESDGSVIQPGIGGYYGPV